MKERILVVDDEESIRFTFEAFLSDEGYDVASAASLSEALPLVREGGLNLVFLDILLGRENGMKILEASRKRSPNCPVIMVTGAPDIATASEAVRLGAFDYITKPVQQEELLRLARLALDHHRLLDEQETDRLRMEAVFQSVQEGILVFDDDLRLVEINDSACRLLACPADVVGHTLDEMSNVGDCTTLNIFRELVEQRCEGEIYRLESVNAAGESIVLGLTMAPLTGQGDRETGVVLVLRDESQPSRQVDVNE